MTPDGSDGVVVSVGDRARGVARLLDGEARVLQLELDRAFAPGRPLSLDLSLAEPEAALLTVRAKTISSVRIDAARFTVRVRLIELRREQRELLRRLFAR